ncbi:hypothetical protein WDU94_008116 [Cyamophila willieti]
MPSVIINNLFKINELVKLTNNDTKAARRPGKISRHELEEDDWEPIAIHRNILFERKIIQIKCKYQVVQQYAKKNYFLQLREGTGWDIYWTDKQFLSPRQLKSMMPYQRINYFPGMSILTNKQNLTQRLNLYKTLFPEEYDFFPQTWIVDKHCENLPSKQIDTNNLNLCQESQGMITDNGNLDPKDTNGNIINIENFDTPSRKIGTLNTILDISAKTEISKPNKTDYDLQIHTKCEDKSDKSCHTRHGHINKKFDHLGKTENKNHELSNIDRIETHLPLRDITNQLDNTRDNVLRDFDESNVSNFNSKLAMFSREHKCNKTDRHNDGDITTKVNEKHDKTNTIDQNRRFAETNHETDVLTDKRTTKEPDSEIKPMMKDLGTKTNSIIFPNLRATVRNKDFKRNSVVQEIIGTPNILLKNNVRNMVQALNRVNKTIETVDKWRNMTKENIANRKNSCDQSEDNIRELDGTNNNRPNDTESKEDLEETRNKGKAVKVASENECKSSTTRVNDESTPIYILKPCDGCQGKGIQLIMNMNEVKHAMEFDSMVCQQYITNPLLWNGYKFDIRLYVLVTSVKQLRIYIYNEGLVRLATEKYEPPNETNINNMYMHLTNYSINKDSENFDENLSKQSLASMNNFLQEEHGVDLKSLYGKINDIIVKTILAGYKPILKEYLETFKMYVYREACFQLLGFDIILDAHCNPYLLEINKNASLKRPTPIDRVIKTNLTRDLFSILNLNENRFRGDILRDNLNYNTYRKRYIEHEMIHRGDFGMIYPGQEDYSKFMID